MSRLSLSLAIPVIHRRRDSDVVEPSLGDGVNVVEELIPEVAEGNSKELGDEVVNKVTTNMITGAAVVVLVVEEDLAGRITISHNGTAMPLSISSRIGKCWKRLISIVLLS